MTDSNLALYTLVFILRESCGQEAFPVPAEGRVWSTAAGATVGLVAWSLSRLTVEVMVHGEFYDTVCAQMSAAWPLANQSAVHKSLEQFPWDVQVIAMEVEGLHEAKSRGRGRKGTGKSKDKGKFDDEAGKGKAGKNDAGKDAGKDKAKDKGKGTRRGKGKGSGWYSGGKPPWRSS